MLTDAVVRAYFRLLSYKDEYEVARLYTQSGFLKKVRMDFTDSARLRFHLAPPVLSRGVDSRGRPRKREFGAWIIPLFRLLASLKSLRGTKLDFFGMTAERKMERALIIEFEDQVDIVLNKLTANNVGLATEIVGEYLEIRGYGPVKEAAAAAARDRISSKINVFASSAEKAA